MANYIDVIISKNIKRIREEKGRTQADIGEAIGVTAQQMQKVEAGTNRITASSLKMLADYLDIPVYIFYDIQDRNTVENVYSGRLIKKFAAIPTHGQRALINFYNEMKDL